MDQDEDNRISREEFVGAAEEFARIDEDEDGALTPDETALASTFPLALLDEFDEADSDGDGELGIEEWDAAFKQADADGNRVLSQEELRQVEGTVLTSLVLAYFGHFDSAPRDGSVIIIEWQAAFQRMDQINPNGKATPREIEASVGQRRRRQRGAAQPAAEQ